MDQTTVIETPATPELPLFDRLPHQMAPASLQHWQHILPTLNARERAVFLSLCRYLEKTHQDDATGGELAAHSGLSILTIRPRLTGLHHKGWITRTLETRDSRAQGEARA